MASPRADRQPPAFSPALLLGLALRPLPTAPLQAAAALAMAAMARRHRAVFERLDGLGNPHFLIEPSDLPIRFLLCVALPSPRLTVLREDEEPAVAPAASIRGPMPALIDLLEGRTDGDALFFSRMLTVAGDTAAVVALRNAVDGADVSLVRDLLAPLGPLGGPARRLAEAGGRLYRRAERDLETVRSALLAPVARRCDAQEGRLRDLDEAMSQLGAGARRRDRRA